MFKYTVCFIKNKNEILMLNREKPPIMGVWNGVGGKIEKGESPDESALREVFEETDIRVDNYFSKGTVCWESSNGVTEGIYVYLYEISNNVKLDTPKKTREGILDWKSIDWVLNPNNLGIADKVSHYLQVFLKEEGIYSLRYKKGKIHIV